MLIMRLWSLQDTRLHSDAFPQVSNTLTDFPPAASSIAMSPQLTPSHARQVNSDPKSALGTLAYTAPEALMNNFFDGSCSDVWCCGVMLYIMVTGALPPAGPVHVKVPKTSLAASSRNPARYVTLMCTVCTARGGGAFAGGSCHPSQRWCSSELANKQGPGNVRAEHLGNALLLLAGKFPFGDPDAADGKHGVQTMIAAIMKVRSFSCLRDCIISISVCCQLAPLPHRTRIDEACAADNSARHLPPPHPTSCHPAILPLHSSLKRCSPRRR